LGPIPNPQSPIPNPQSPILLDYLIYFKRLILEIKNKKIKISLYYFSLSLIC